MRRSARCGDDPQVLSRAFFFKPSAQTPNLAVSHAANRKLVLGGVHLFEVHLAHAFAAVARITIDILAIVPQSMDQGAVDEVGYETDLNGLGHFEIVATIVLREQHPS
ncbi:MAG: hypothetical protein C0461_01735 [Brevundimonas sp.]|nr:hypothetical protein [Brevundimonas sp.]